MKTKGSYAHCSVFVQGMVMRCPLCDTLVKSGERHECKKLEAAPKPVIGIGRKGRKVAV